MHKRAGAGKTPRLKHDESSGTFRHGYATQIEGKAPPGTDPAEIRYATRQAVTEAGPAGAGLLYCARRVYHARGPA